jgi:hypothetical protein
MNTSASSGSAGSGPTHGQTPQDDASDKSGMRLFDAFEGLFGRFFRLAGSATLITAVLIYAGFLSDYGAYRLAGLPRLNMNLTALVEQGADTLIDSIALLGGGGRAWVLALSLVGVVLVWGWRQCTWMQGWSQSVEVYRCLRIALLLLAVLLTGAMFERAQRSLSGDQHGALAIREALASVYDDERFASTYEREMAIQEQTYMLRGLSLVNLLARWQARHDSSADQVTGLALRPIAEARTAARHVYGWLSLLAVLLTTGLVLLLWWGQALNVHDDATGQPADPPAAGSTPWLLRAITRLMGGLGDSAGQPVERLLAPLSLLLAAISLALLPLAHGLLARPSLGAETVMVYLDSGQPEVKAIQEPSQDKATGQDVKSGNMSTRRKEVSEQDVPDSVHRGPDARLDCAVDLEGALAEPLRDYRRARREVLQTRATNDRFEDAVNEFAKRTEALARKVIEQNCAEAVAVFWAAQPSDGTRARHPDLAETYFKSLRAVQAAYGVQVGTLLGYPRDGSGLTLASAIVPTPLPRGGRSSVSDIGRDKITESVVIPNLDGRDLAAAMRHLVVDPDNVRNTERLLLADKGSALDFMADMLRSERMHASAAGVTVTTLGTMAQPSAYASPKAADKAVDLLIELAGHQATAWWPAKTDDIRGTSISSLHLAHLPYAAHRFIRLMRDEPVPEAGCAKARPPTPAACLSTVPTAAGYLLQDLVDEIQHFQTSKDQRAPTALAKDRDDLVQLLFAIALQPAVPDPVRGAACSALALGGKQSVPAKGAQQFSQKILEQPADDFPLSANGCVQVLTVLGLKDAELRPALRAMVRGRMNARRSELIGRLRGTALVAMADLGIASEDELAFELYLEQGAGGDHLARLGGLLPEYLDDVAPEPLAQRLWQCGADRSRPDALRSHCLAGFALLDDNYDGDDGPAQAIYDLLAGGEAPAGNGACDALLNLRRRDSSALRRIPTTDPVLRACTDKLAS